MGVSRAVLPILLLTLSSCGPIMGQLMKAGEGVQSLEVTGGSLSELRDDARLLVVGPFAKTEQAFYICRGEDAANFSDALRDAGLFRTELYLERDYSRAEAKARELRGMTPQQLKGELGLADEPDVLLFGTILHRSMIVAPMRGVVTEVGYRLEFLDLASGRSVTVEVSVKEPFEHVVRDIANELAARRSGGG